MLIYMFSVLEVDNDEDHIDLPRLLGCRIGPVSIRPGMRF